jgi:hypothetical protein
VLLNNGDGTFGIARNYAVGDIPLGVAVADLDGDGHLDLVAANYDSGTVSVLRGNGDGSFQPARHFAAGGGPHAVAVGDFDGDGRLDLAVAGDGVNVLLGNGDGSFQAPLRYNSGAAPSSLAAADLNGDGWPDLVVANRSSDNVSILFNDGHWPGGGGAPRGRARPGGGRSPGVLPAFAPGRLAGEAFRVDGSPTPALPPPPVTVPVAEPPWTATASVRTGTESPPAQTRAASRVQAEEALRRRPDRLFAGAEGNGLWDRLPDAVLPSRS